ncbi:DUF3180 domain-containing protein [Actinomyces sp. zg-332]|uniref:DUF3180 family protein n=1 Tax=Actinomyces sp. zg-332 TaxID=2708340 RepID=UPI00141EBE73|nr:DUF3180 family protein [Actinomyces sp. zg-332]QPK94047.1 DUF3180 domain-containing protein [Actinomyces sp. zg-332]
MTKTKISSLVLAFTIFLISSFTFILSVIHSGFTPPLASWILPIFMLIFSGILALAGWKVRKYKSDKTVEVDQFKAAKLVIFAKTSSIGGACISGFTFAQTIIFIMYSESMFMQDMIIVSLASFLSCILFATTGIIVENWCIVDDGDDLNTSSTLNKKLSSNC